MKNIEQIIKTKQNSINDNYMIINSLELKIKKYQDLYNELIKPYKNERGLISSKNFNYNLYKEFIETNKEYLLVNKLLEMYKSMKKSIEEKNYKNGKNIDKINNEILVKDELNYKLTKYLIKQKSRRYMKKISNKDTMSNPIHDMFKIENLNGYKIYNKTNTIPITIVDKILSTIEK